MLRKQQFSAARIIVVILIMSIASSIVLAANNPGHDTLYILKVGDNMTGSLNLTGNLTAYGIQTATFLYGSGLDIWANGSTQQAVSSKPTIQAAGTNLFIDNPLAGDLRFNTIAGTSNLVRFGTGSIGVIVNGTLNVVNHSYINGTIRIYSNGSGSFSAGTTVGGSAVCTSANGLCSGGATGFTQWRLGSNTGTIAAITNNTLVNITGGTTITTTLSGSTITLAVPTGGIGVAQIAAAVNTSYDTRYATLAQLTAAVGQNLTYALINTNMGNASKHVGNCGVGTAIQNITATGIQCAAAGGGSGITGSGTTGTLPVFVTNTTNIGNSIVSQSGNTLTINGNISTPTNFWIGNGAAASATSATAIGEGANAMGAYSFAAGWYSLAGTTDGSMAFGPSTTANGTYSMALGGGATVNGTGAIGIGYAKINGPYAIAIGDSTNVSHANSIAIGQHATSTAANQLIIGNISAAAQLNTRIYGTLNVSGATYLGNSICSAGQFLQTSSTGLVSCQTPAGATGFSQWRLGSNTGTLYAVTNNTIVNITGDGSTITTTLNTGNITISIPNQGINVAQIAAAVNTSYDTRYTTPTYVSGAVGQNLTYALITTANGNWSLDKPSYATLTQLNGGVGQNLTYALINTNMGNASKLVGNCAAGTVVMNITAAGIQCVAASGGGGGNITGTGAAGNISYWTNSTNLANTNMYYSGGAVGIGASTPLSRLSIVSADNNYLTDIVKFTYDTSNNYRSGIGVQFDGGTIANNRMVFRVSDATATGQTLAMTLLGNGNVGIGTTAPTQKLDVNGSVNINDNITMPSGVMISYDGTAYTDHMVGIAIGDGAVATRDSVAIGGSANVGGYRYSVALGSSSRVNADYQVAIGNPAEEKTLYLHGDMMLNGTTSTMAQATCNPGALSCAGYSLTLQAGNASYVAGPSTKGGNLYLRTGASGGLSTSQVVIEADQATNSTASILHVGSSGTGNIYLGGTTSNSRIYDAAGDLTLDSDTAQTIIAEDLRINGNDILDSGGALRLTLGATGNYNGSFTVNGSAARFTVNSSASTGSVVFGNTTGSTHLFVEGNTGEIGIGTATPAYHLDLATTLSGASPGSSTAGFNNALNRAYAGGSAGGIIGGEFLTLTDSTGPSALSSQAARITFNRNNNNISSAYDIGVVSFASINNGNGGSFYDYMANGVIVASNINISTRIGVYATDSSGAGTLTSQYGVYVAELTKGASNYAIYTVGATPSYFGGRVLIGPGTPGNATGTGDLWVNDSIEYEGALYGPGADLAELIYGSEPLEAGDVVIADEMKEETVKKTSIPYNTAVIGVVSSDPGILLSKNKGDVPLALSGRVPIKVSAENGPIHPGDLLTTSSNPGHAMRCASRQECQGAIVAKSLGTLEAGTGKITALVMLG